MIQYKTNEDIKKMAEGGKILAEVLGLVISKIGVGVSELEIEKLANEEILKHGATPSFKRVKGYRYATCISTNNVVVHGVPTDYRFKKGDIVGVDCGVYYKGFNTDMAETIKVQSSALRLRSGQEFKVQNEEDKTDFFLTIGKKALEEAIKVAKVGNRVGHISKTIQRIVEGAGYSVVRSLIGHGVGRRLHEEPEVPGFLDIKIEKTPLLKEGMTLAIEVIYNMGKSEVIYETEGEWTIKTKDKSISGLFERTIAITRNGSLVLTE